MNDEKYYVTAFGVYMLGFDLVRLAWAIETSETTRGLASYLDPFRFYHQTLSFEDIGSQARAYQEKLLNSKERTVSEGTRRNLRNLKARWDGVIRERLANLYVITPVSKIDPKKLLGGVKELLNEKSISFLKRIEIVDLTEATNCILVGSATAAEHITLRAAESILRRWYYYKTGKELHYNTWGAVIDKLSEEYEEAKRPEEIAYLDHLKLRRNEVAHPERISSLSEAESTLFTVCSLIESVEPIVTSLAAKRKRKEKATKKHGG